MNQSLLILLLITGALLISTEGQQDYHRLSGIYKKVIDKAIQHCNGRSQQHMNFIGFLKNSEKSNPFYIELHLKATNCKNTGETTHQDKCKFMNGKPFINCAVCTEDETSFPIHCTPQRKVNQSGKEREALCKNYQTGGVNLLAQQLPAEDRSTECLGCF